MQYDPKLKKAMEQIKKIIEENDIAAFVALHTPGYTEYFNKVDPSFSCAFLADNQLRVRLKTEEVGKEKAKELEKGTFNMITHFSDILSAHALLYLDTEKILEKSWPFKRDNSSGSSHTEQNN
jgi:hypothetical protein